MNDHAVAPKCLAGVRVLEPVAIRGRAACSEVLAMLGAEVVKVENPKGESPAAPSAPDPHRGPTATTS